MGCSGSALNVALMANRNEDNAGSRKSLFVWDAMKRVQYDFTISREEFGILARGVAAALTLLISNPGGMDRQLRFEASSA